MIREKLGLAGLEKINALAEACAANDPPAAFSLIDEFLGSGVAIEQLVIDLAGYYRSLLLLKNGITRESLLGYNPGQFSAKVLEILDPIRLEQALEILLACYRDIRYSVSPRFELETAVSKLSWLNKWVSPPELKAALDVARGVLQRGTSVLSDRCAGLGAGTALPPETARPTQTKVPAGQPGLDAPQKGSNQRFGGVQSLAEEYRRMLAEKGDSAVPANGGGEIKNESAEDEAPLDRMLRIIPGTVVN
jgi:DNA polymerase-3 subunit gamma/tau